MKMSQKEYDKHLDENSGYCLECAEVTCEDADPDGDEMLCPQCSNFAVVGMERALMYENIFVSDDEDDVSFISFSDDED